MEHPVLNVWPDAPRREAGRVVLSCVLERPGGERGDLWYSVPESMPYLPGGGGNAFAIAAFFFAMAVGAELRVHATVSPALLRNLEELSLVWHRWNPSRYRPIRLRADREEEREGPPGAGYVTALSGGLDSLFTLYRHVTGRCGRQRRRIDAALMVHGFDIPLGRTLEWEAARASTEALCRELGVEFLSVSTNWRELGAVWEDGFGAALAACLTLFSGSFQGALVAGDEPYDFILPWGATPLIMPMYSSGDFCIINDGAGFSRVDKAALVSEWDLACEKLRVCWAGPEKHKNCCRCEKCIRTILNFRVAADILPRCFESDVTLDHIRSIKVKNDIQLFFLQDIVDHADASGRGGEEWVRVLVKRLRFFKAKRLKRQFWMACRDGFRRLYGRIPAGIA